ncbi:transport protein TonB [Grimontia celer]|uniref:Protein TonB n=1 Tax=Grimontia celer TaxID=1796497 RepID=A0A128F6W1_9GAMM|nr:energy transducer TonB [Grimontia celer]CZF82036.1 transport protein TonB [Grimontia celer]
MNTRRYVVCGVVSVALHSLAIWAQPPSPQFTINDANAGNRVAIQLIASTKQVPKEPEPAPVEDPPQQETTKPEPKPVKSPSVKKESPKKAEVETQKKVKPEVNPPKETRKKPLEKVTKKESKEEKTKPLPPKKPIEKPEEKPKETAEEMSKENQMTQAKSSSPMLVERPTFKVRPSQPKYPRMAKRKGMEGTVLIEVWLDEEGNQTNRSLLKSSGFELLDGAAMDAVKKWRFNGHEENGVALAHRVRIPVRFNLD